MRALLFLRHLLFTVMVVNLGLISVFAGQRALTLESTSTTAVSSISSAVDLDLEQANSFELFEASGESESETDSEDSAELELWLPITSANELQLIDGEIKLSARVGDLSDQWLRSGLERPPRA